MIEGSEGQVKPAPRNDVLPSAERESIAPHLTVRAITDRQAARFAPGPQMSEALAGDLTER